MARFRDREGSGVLRRSGEEESAPVPARAVEPAAARSREQPDTPWFRHWELWLALGLGAFLRLWHVDTSMFLSDQALLMAIARQGLLLGALPITGMPFSLGMLSPAFSDYLLMPFAALTRDPFPVVISVALWNTLGILLCYIFTQRYFGRRAAGASALLFATCGATVDYSRYLWQTNYMPPFVALFGLALFAWCVEGRRGWFAAVFPLLTVVTLLHPAGVYLLPMVLGALVLAPVAPRLWAWGLGIGGATLLLAPTVLWEVLSGGSDVRMLSQYGQSPAHVDLAALAVLYEMLGRPASVIGLEASPDGSWPGLIRLLLHSPSHVVFRQDAAYNALGRANVLIPLAALALFLAGWLILTFRTLKPVLRPASVCPASTDRNLWQRGVRRWSTVRGDTTWRASVLLWLWVSLPVLLQLRHSTPVYPHYLMTLYPGVFVLSGIGAAWLIERASALGRMLFSPPTPGSRVLRAVPGLGIGMLVALLVAGQFAQSALFVTSMARAQYDMAAGGFDNLPVRALEAADATLTRLQRREHAGTAFVLTQPSRDASLTYMLVSEHPGRVRVPDACLILPAPSSSPALIVSSRASSDAAQFLSGLPGVQHIADMPLPGGEPLQVFRVPALVPTSPGETHSAALIFRDGAGNGLELDGVAWSRPGVMRLRWTVLASTPDGTARTWFRIAADTRAAGGALQAASTVDCQPTAWQAGEEVYTWLPVQGAKSGLQPVVSTTPRSGAVVLSVQEQTTAPGVHQIGPLRVLSFDDLATPMKELPAVPAPPS